MTHKLRPNYHILDRPEILARLFHPRPQPEGGTLPPSSSEVTIPVDDGILIGGCFHMSSATAVNILFFHGNGEIVADYHELGPIYNRSGINFLAVDYRGYGRSNGAPGVESMMKDCHIIFDFARAWLQENGYSGALAVMGRSLGSASALELAATHAQALGGLIIESGFAYAAPLLRLLGIEPESIGYEEAAGFLNIDKISRFHKPTLIIHAEQDHIIPCSEGEALFAASPAEQKFFFKVPGANHNDIFLRSLTEYLGAVKKLTEVIKR